MSKELLRALPKVDELLKEEKIINLVDKYNRSNVVDRLRETLDYYRQEILSGERVISPYLDEVINKCSEKLEEKSQLNLRRVVNGTGVVIHTNLGRSVLSKEATDAIVKVASHYNNLEYHVTNGTRGSRYSHIEDIIKEVTGAESALVVNNNAAAIMVTINSLCENREVIVSRGELVEIGGSFRVPDVISFSKATLKEVGTTNKTHLYDYGNAITEYTSAFLKVHSSNFKIVGFTKSVGVSELATLGKKHNILVIEDIGSGSLIDLSKYGLEKEPTVRESLENGADVVTFSGDKMLGGPQAGIIVGKKKYIDRIKKNQLTRALRVDKFTLAALEATLKQYMQEEEALKMVPTLRMLTANNEELRIKSEELRDLLLRLNDVFQVRVEKGESTVGGGAMPDSKLETYLVKIKSDSITEDKLEKRLRENSVPIISRIIKGEVCLDVRTLLEDDFNVIYSALKEIGESL